MNDLKVTLDYIPDNCIEPQAVAIDNMVIRYCQNPDTNSNSDEYQFLEIETQESGGGFYFNIKTDKWSIDDPQDLANIIQDFKNRLESNTVPMEELKCFEK